jgi:selenoprotein W-related protein
MSLNPEVKVDIEYCGVCNFTRHCQELKDFLAKTVPEAKVSCNIGRRGSFEVKINETLVHSKMQTMAFPVYEDVAVNVKNCMEGKEVKKVKEQTIKECCVM